MAGLRRGEVPDDSAALYLLLGETGYNPLRTATYVLLCMLERAFSDPGLGSVRTEIPARHAWLTDVLLRMGFIRTDARDGLLCFSVEKEAFQEHRYLF